jgi:DNA-binding NarL/FixJ family response regulator
VSGAERPRLRVLLVDDHLVVRVGLRALLGTDPGVEVVGEAGDGEEALRLWESLRPDVGVVDLSMDGLDGTGLTRELVRRWPDARVLILTMHDEEDYLIPLLEAGATGYIVKSAASQDLLQAIRTVSSGQVYVRPAAAKVLAAGWTRRAAPDQARALYESLSEREREVLRLLAEGHTPSQVGERLFISAKTVDTYRRRINEKTGFRERSEYVRLALDLGLIA